MSFGSLNLRTDLSNWLVILCFCARSIEAAAGIPVSFTITDETGAPLPARIHLRDDSGKAWHTDFLAFVRDFVFWLVHALGCGQRGPGVICG